MWCTFNYVVTKIVHYPQMKFTYLFCKSCYIGPVQPANHGAQTRLTLKELGDLLPLPTEVTSLYN